MAKKMNYVDERGVSYDESYWRLCALSVDVDAKRGEFTFRGYRDATARSEQKAAIGEKTFYVIDAEFEIYYAEHLVNGKNIAEIAYLIATNQKFPTGEFTEPNPDANGEPGMPEEIMVGFFDGAEDLI